MIEECLVPVELLIETTCELVHKNDVGQLPWKIGAAGDVVGKMVVPFWTILTDVYELG